MLGGRTDVPSMLSVVRPGADLLLLLFENDTLCSKWSHWGSIEVKITKELVVSGQLRVDLGRSYHVEVDDSLGNEATPEMGGPVGVTAMENG